MKGWPKWMRWAVLAALGLVLSLALLVLVGTKTSNANPGLRLQFVSYTNIQGKWCAEMVLTNHSEHLHFVEAWGNIPKYGGWATTGAETNELSGIQFSGGPLNVPSRSVRWLRVVLPPQTKSWEIGVWCYRSDFFSRNLLDGTGRWNWVGRLPEPIVELVAKLFIYPTWDRGFEVSSSTFTNLPPSP